MSRKFTICNALTLLVVFLNLCPVGHAQSIDPIARPHPIIPGRYFVDIVADFTAQPALGGSFDIVFDEPPLEFVAWEYNPALFSHTTINPSVSTGLVASAGFGVSTCFGDPASGLTGDVTIGTLTLDAGSTVGTPSVHVRDAATGTAGPFIDCVDFVSVISVAYGATTIDLSSANPVLFSLDLGSDNEISDPSGTSVDERNDPGDVFAASLTAGTLFSGPIALNDADYFGTPEPPPVRGLIASACAPGGTTPLDDCFDLDGYDSIGTRISELSLNGTPLLRGETQEIACVHTARHLAISFNDDPVRGAGAGSPPRVPTEGPSPAGMTYGTTAGQDEVIGLTIATEPITGSGILAAYPLTDEVGLHVDLAPNPNALERFDDDVDALDMRDSPDCNVHYFSADDEAAGGLNRASIYEYDPSSATGYVEVLTGTNLGVSPGTDIDAFEFAWVSISYIPLTSRASAGQAQEALAVIFSVDPDKMFDTPVIDESGAKDANSIYVSFMDGNAYELVDGVAYGLDDVDAITVSKYDIRTDGGDNPDGDWVPYLQDNCTLEDNPGQIDADQDGIGNRCDADANQDCVVNILDLGLLREAFFTTDPVWDLNDDGTVNVGDLGIFKGYFFARPGPSGIPNICSGNDASL